MDLELFAVVGINTKKLPGVILVLLSLLIGAFAQLTLLITTQDLRVAWQGKVELANISTSVTSLPGYLLYILAGILFILGLRYLGDTTWILPISVVSIPKPKPKRWFWIISIGLAIVTAIHAGRANGNGSADYAFAAAWALSILLFVIGILMSAGWRLPSGTETLGWFKNHRAEIFAVAAIVVAAFLVRFLDVELHPYAFSNDEGQMGSSGSSLLRGITTNLFDAEPSWSKQPWPAFLPDAVSIALFGKTAFAIRLVSVIIGTLSVLAVYLFAREVFSAKIAWVSAVLLAALPVHVHFSRLGTDHIVDSLSASLVLWLIFRGAKRASTLSFLAAGVVAGLSIYTYPGSWLAPALGVGALGYIALRTPGFFRAHARNIVIFGVAGVIVALPIMGYYATHQDFFLARARETNILLYGRLQLEMQTDGKNAVEVLADHFERASRVFIVGLAPYGGYNSPEPYLIPLAAILFMLGLAYTLWRVKGPHFMTLLAWFWVPVILGSALTGGPPTSERTLMSTPALAIITAIGMIKTVNALRQSGKLAAKIAPVLVLILVLYIGFNNINFYFHDYRIGHYIEDPKDELTYETRVDIAPLHSQGRLYLIATPDVPYLSFGSFDFFAPDVEKNYFEPASREALATLSPDKDALFIATPDRISDLKLILQWIPGGQWQEVRRRYQPDQVLYYSYQISKDQLAAFKP